MRLFRCRYCNHVNRYGRGTCSYCFKPTTVWNRAWLPLALIAAVAGIYVWSAEIDLTLLASAQK